MAHAALPRGLAREGPREHVAPAAVRFHSDLLSKEKPHQYCCFGNDKDVELRVAMPLFDMGKPLGEYEVPHGAARRDLQVHVAQQELRQAPHDRDGRGAQRNLGIAFRPRWPPADR